MNAFAFVLVLLGAAAAASAARPPSLVSVQEQCASGPNHICAGTILGKKYVVTSFECVRPYVADPAKVSVLAEADSNTAVAGNVKVRYRISWRISKGFGGTTKRKSF